MIDFSSLIIQCKFMFEYISWYTVVYDRVSEHMCVKLLLIENMKNFPFKITLIWVRDILLIFLIYVTDDIERISFQENVFCIRDSLNSIRMELLWQEGADYTTMECSRWIIYE